MFFRRCIFRTGSIAFIFLVGHLCADLIVLEDGMVTGKATFKENGQISVLSVNALKSYSTNEVVEIRFDGGRKWERGDEVPTGGVTGMIPKITRTPAKYDTLLHYETDALKYYHIVDVPDSDYVTLDRLAERVKVLVSKKPQTTREYQEALKAIHQLIENEMADEVSKLQFTFINRDPSVRSKELGVILLCARNSMMYQALADFAGMPLYLVVPPSPYEGNGHVAVRLDPDGLHQVATSGAAVNEGDFEWETTEGKITTEAAICGMAGVPSCKPGEKVYLRNLNREETVGFFFQTVALYLGKIKQHARGLPISEIAISLYRDPISYLNLSGAYINSVFGDMPADAPYPHSAGNPTYSLAQSRRALEAAESGLQIDPKCTKLAVRRADLQKKIAEYVKYQKDQDEYKVKMKEYERKLEEYKQKKAEYDRQKEEYDRAMQERHQSR